jgi:hypothetical protein
LVSRFSAAIFFSTNLCMLVSVYADRCPGVLSIFVLREQI